MIKKTIAYVLLSALLTSAARTGGQPSSTAPPSGPADGTILTEGTIATEGASAAISEESPVSRSALEWIPGDIRTGVCSWKSPLAIAGGPGIVPIPSKFGVVEPALTEEEGTAQEDKGSEDTADTGWARIQLSGKALPAGGFGVGPVMDTVTCTPSQDPGTVAAVDATVDAVAVPTFIDAGRSARSAVPAQSAQPGQSIQSAQSISGRWLGRDSSSGRWISEEDLQKAYALMEEAAGSWTGGSDPLIADLSGTSIPADAAPLLLNGFISHHPECFFLTGDGAYTSVGQYIGQIMMDADSGYTAADVASFKKKAADVLSDVGQGWTDAQKVLYIHDHIVTHTAYDESLSKFNAYDALVGGSAVCQGYSLLFQYYMDSLGIECDIVGSEELGHAWNAVNVNGAWYYIDCTWDDPVGPYGLFCSHRNMLRSRAGFVEEGHEGTDWAGPLGEKASTIPTGSMYEGYFWKDVESAIPMIGKDCYYGDGKDIHAFDIYELKDAILCSHPAVWKDWAGDAVYDKASVHMAGYGPDLLASTPTQVFRIGTDGQREEILTLDAGQQSKGYIYGISVEGDTLYYDLYQGPDGEKVGSGKLSLKEALGYLPVEGILITPSRLDMEKGEAHKIYAKISPSEATDQGIYWASSAPHIVFVDAIGTATAKKNGTAVVTARTADGQHISTCSVTVGVPVKDLSLDKEEISLAVGGTETLAVEILPTEAAEGQELVWESTSPDVASVTDGRVTGNKEGSAFITVRTADGCFMDGCTAHVLAGPGTALDGQDAEDAEDACDPAGTDTGQGESPGTEDTDSQGPIPINGHEGSIAEPLIVQPAMLSLPLDALGKVEAVAAVPGYEPGGIYWASTDNSVAVVDHTGTVIPISPGQAMIVAMDSNSGAAACILSVEGAGDDDGISGSGGSGSSGDKIPVQGISFVGSSLSLAPGESVAMEGPGQGTSSYVFQPEDATDQGVSWYSTDSRIVSVDGGRITGISTGEAIIAVKAEDGGYGDTLPVYVSWNKPAGSPGDGQAAVGVMSLRLDREDLVLEKGKGESLAVTIDPEGATGQKIVWSSSDDSIASVLDGYVYGVSEGKATISAATEDGTISAHCAVTVLDHLDGGSGDGDTGDQDSAGAEESATGGANGMTVPRKDQKVSFLKETVLLLKGGSVKPGIYVPEGISALSWSSDDEAVATVDADGNVTGRSKGKARISVTWKVGGTGGTDGTDGADGTGTTGSDDGGGSDGITVSAENVDNVDNVDNVENATCTILVFEEGDGLSTGYGTDAGQDGDTGKDVYIAVDAGDGKLGAGYKKNLDKKVAEVTIPDWIEIAGEHVDVAAIGDDALKGYKKLRRVSIGANVRSIGKNAFKGCKKLKRVYLSPKGLQSGDIAPDAFKKIKEYCQFYVPLGEWKDYRKWLKQKGTRKIRVIGDKDL